MTAALNKTDVRSHCNLMGFVIQRTGILFLVVRILYEKTEKKKTHYQRGVSPIVYNPDGFITTSSDGIQANELTTPNERYIRSRLIGSTEEREKTWAHSLPSIVSASQHQTIPIKITDGQTSRGKFIHKESQIEHEDPWERCPWTPGREVKEQRLERTDLRSPNVRSWGHKPLPQPADHTECNTTVIGLSAAKTTQGNLSEERNWGELWIALME
ncbi:hypothetical protein EDD85DRAFT_971353 [Armillaria nabsnona]|nr:hypothetical protein EDD85DRAFT_971353 [Armillaria nabsnona]